MVNKVCVYVSVFESMEVPVGANLTFESFTFLCVFKGVCILLDDLTFSFVMRQR